MKIHFGRKWKKSKNDQIAHFGADNENEFQSASSLMAWPKWSWPPQILRQIYATAQGHRKCHKSMGTYDFLLVIRINYESIPYRFRDKARFW